MSKRRKNITRKDFIKKSSIGIIGAGMIGRGPVSFMRSNNSLAVSQIGQTGIETTKLGIGATRTQEPSIIRAAIEGGIRFLDTGRTYANGKNEEMIGDVLKDFRKEITIQSKVRLSKGQIQGKLKNESRENIVSRIFNKSLEESLVALQTDYIDIMLFHGAEEVSLLFDEAVLKAFESAKTSGKIRACGFSCHANMTDLVGHNIKNPFYDTVMVAFNHNGGYIHANSGRKSEWNQEALVNELKKAATAGTGIVAMKTCSGGAHSLEPGREASIPQAVRWVLNQNFIHAAVPAMASFSQVESHLKENMI